MNVADNLTEKFHETLISVEENTSIRYPSERSEVFRQFYGILEQKGEINTELARQVMWECMLFDLRFKPENIIWRGEKGKVFLPRRTLSNGRVNPDTSDFTDETFVYFRKRANETKSPIHKCRYCEAVWVLSGADDKHIYARLAIDAYLECADIYFKNISLHVSCGIQFSHALQRATELVLKPGIADEGKIQEVKTRVFFFLDSLVANSHYRWCLYLTRTMLEYKNRLKKDETDKLITISKQTAEFCKNNHDYDFQRKFLLNLINVCKHVNEDSFTQSFQEEIAESYKLEGDYVRVHRSPGNILAAHFYAESAEKYKVLGKKEIGDELIDKVKECYRLAENEFVEIRTPVDIPMSGVDNYVNTLLQTTPRDALKQISVESSLIPNIERATLQSEEDKIFHPLSTHLPSASIRDTKKVYDSVTSDDPLDHNIRKNILLAIQFKKIILAQIFEKLKEKSFFNEGILTEFLSESELIDKENLKLVRVGIQRYFREDFVSALHILVPQFEDILRKILEKTGVIQVTKLSSNRMQDSTLNEILKKKEVQEFFGKDFATYLYLVLVSQQGFNLRNDIAHGFIKEETCTKEITNLILHMYLVLASFRIEKIVV